MEVIDRVASFSERILSITCQVPYHTNTPTTFRTLPPAGFGQNTTGMCCVRIRELNRFVFGTVDRFGPVQTHSAVLHG